MQLTVQAHYLVIRRDDSHGLQLQESGHDSMNCRGVPISFQGTNFVLRETTQHSIVLHILPGTGKGGVQNQTGKPRRKCTK